MGKSIARFKPMIRHKLLKMFFLEKNNEAFFQIEVLYYIKFFQKENILKNFLTGFLGVFLSLTSVDLIFFVLMPIASNLFFDPQTCVEQNL